MISMIVINNEVYSGTLTVVVESMIDKKLVIDSDIYLLLYYQITLLNCLF